MEALLTMLLAERSGVNPGVSNGEPRRDGRPRPDVAKLREQVAAGRV
jgi:hypothetical protein